MTDQTAAQRQSRLPDLTGLLPKTGFGLLAFLSGWLLLHAIIRLTLTDVIGVDDVEQQIFSQSLDAGYHPKQPPLYTWMMYFVQELTGPGLLAVVLVKYVHLAAFLLTYWALCCRLLVSQSHRIATMLGLLLIFQYAWQVHAGFTHSLTLLVTSALAFLQLLRLADRPGLLNYLLFGLAAGLGMLSKYNFALALIALVTAAASIPVYRHIVFQRRILISIGAMLLVIIVPGLWLVGQIGDLLGSGGSPSIVADSTTSLGDAMQKRASGLASLAGATAGYLSPLLLVLAWPLLRGRNGHHGTGIDSHRLTGRFLMAGLSLLAVAILVSGIDAMKARWLHPLLFIAPVWMMRHIERSDGAWTENARRIFAIAVLAFSLLSPVMRITEYYVGPPFCKHCRPTWPQTALAEQLWADMPAPAGLAFAMDDHLAGNLRSRLPGLRVMTPHYAFYQPFTDRLLPNNKMNRGETIHCIAIWNRDKAGDAIPGPLHQQMIDAGVSLEKDAPVRDIIAENPVISGRQHAWRWIWIPNCLTDAATIMTTPDVTGQN